MKTLVIVDNNLSGERGHHLALARSITEGAFGAGVDVVWGAHAALSPQDVSTGVAVERCFPTSGFELPSEEKNTRDLAPGIAEGWNRLIDIYDAATTHFLVPTANGHLFRAALNVLESRPARASVVHLCTPYETCQMPSRHIGREIDRCLWCLAQRSDYGRSLFLWAENEHLAAAYCAQLEARIETLPLPSPGWTETVEPPRGRSRVEIGFLGPARVEKGFLDLPGIVSSVLDAGDLRGIVDFRIQTAARSGGHSPELARAVQALAHMQHVTTYPSLLSDGAYRDILTGVDAILLPYREQEYAIRGSGILVEAISCGKIILASASTELASYADDAAMFVCSSPDEWLAAIREIAARRDELVATAWRRAVGFRYRRAAGTYIQRLAMRYIFA